MKIKYRKIPDLFNPDGFVWVPILQVGLRYGGKGRKFGALVDSGAIDCIFPESVGTLIGIDVPSGQPKTYFGLADQEATGFLHSVDLQITGFDQWVKIEAGFVKSDIVPLLGQSGFFSNYQVVFERFRLQFEVKTKMDALMRGKKGGR